MIKILLTVVTSLGTVMVPRMANTYINGDKKQLLQYMNRSFRFVFLLAFPIIFGIIAISKYFVPIFFGAGYEKVIVLMNIISPILLAIGLSNAIGTQFLLQTKRQKEFTISVIAGAIINFLINILLIGRYASVGAATGTVIAEVCVTAIQFVYIKTEFKIIDILKLSVKYCISAVIMFIVCIIIGIIIYNKIYAIITQFLIGILVYGSCLLILKDDFVYLILNKIKLKFKKIGD